MAKNNNSILQNYQVDNQMELSNWQALLYPILGSPKLVLIIIVTKIVGDVKMEVWVLENWNKIQIDNVWILKN
jgi:hypothetical protein